MTSKCKIQRDYLEWDFFTHATSWNSLEELERKLDRYKESVNVLLGDAETGEGFQIYCTSAVEAVNILQNLRGEWAKPRPSFRGMVWRGEAQSLLLPGACRTFPGGHVAPGIKSLVVFHLLSSTSHLPPGTRIFSEKKSCPAR